MGVGGVGVEGGGGYSIFMHGRSRMIIDTRIPTMPGQSMPGFNPPGRHCLHKAIDPWGGGVCVEGGALSNRVIRSRNLG